jgi:hypothetical protein
VDDYGCSSFQAKRAVDEFLVAHEIKCLNWIDHSGVWWRKE